MICKTCRGCGTQFPATTEYFYKRTDNPDGLTGQCKACRALVNKKYREKNRETIAQKRHEHYIQTRDHFLEYARRYREANKEELKTKRDKYYKENRERLAKKSAEYHKKNKDKMRDYYREYARKNRLKIRAKGSLRYARKMAAEGKWTDEDIKKIYELQRGKCWWCGKKLNGIYHVDHRIPLVRGGTNWPNNLVLSCEKCNVVKGKKTPDEFTGRLL